MSQQNASALEAPSNVIETITAQCVFLSDVPEISQSKNPEACEEIENSGAVESDITAIANVRELLLGDVIRSIREEVLCNHSIILNRFEALHVSTSKRMDVIVKKLVRLKRELDVESSNRTKQLRALKNRLSIEDQAIRAELTEVEAQLNEAAQVAKTDLEDKIIAQARNLIRAESRLSDRLDADVSKLGTEKLKRTELADSLRALADQVNQSSPTGSAHSGSGQ